MKIGQETSTTPLRKETDVKKGSSVQPKEKVREAFVPTTTVTDDQHDTDRSNEHQKYSPVHPFKEHTTTTSSSNSSLLVNSTQSTTRKTPHSQQQLPPDFERTLLETAEREVRKSLLNNNDIDRLQDTLLQTIGKHITTKNDDSSVLNKLFDDLKQAIVETLIQQQQPTLLQGIIKQTVFDALAEQQKSSAGPATTTERRNNRKPVTIATGREIKISANLKQTRNDATFRQQRDAVVANKRLRDIVQQWSSVDSMANLVTTIKTHGKNNLECAWLLFCWIGQNIQYETHCNNNSAETVFRTKKGVCRGFVSLYHECCSLLGIECSEISGYAKQAFLKRREDLKDSPHAWNSIVLDQHTFLIDTTWGAGGRDNDRKLEDFYFLTSPEELIYTHYSNGYQLLEPEVSKDDFLSLPVMKSVYYRLGLTLLSPKQGLNETSENLFKIVIRTPADVDLFAQLKVGDIEYPRNLHTLCQRDETQSDVYNCYITPPVDGLYDVAIYAKTNNETVYYNAIDMRLRVSNITNAFTFPLLYSIFTEHKCILIEPLQRFVHENEQVLIHMIIPNANVIKIRNGDDYMVPCKDEYKKGILKKTVRVQGDLHVCGRWDDKADSISTLCVFDMF
jgi:transglutaminase/protease-like cytokinesis protein 3